LCLWAYSYDYRREINHDNFLGTGGKLASAWAELVKSMWLSKSKVVEPSTFKKRMSTFAPQFSGCQQHDAQELISFLLDGIHEDLNRVQKKPYIEEKDCDGTNDEQDAIESWKNYLLRNKSLIVDLFQGQVRSTCSCRQCGHRNIRFEPFMYLSLPISDSCRSVEDCLKLYLAEEDLTGDNQWYCEKCKTHVDAKKKIDLWILPPILIIHLKRFKYNESGRGGSKNNVELRYPIKSWDLCSQVQSKGGEYPLYDMYAVSNHLGGLGSGHYTAYALNRFDDQWYEFNDSNSRAIDPEQKITKSSTPYLLFYNRASQDDAELSGSNGRSMMIRRQSENRPDLWPHAQVRDAKFRDYSRTSIQHGSKVAFFLTDLHEEDGQEESEATKQAADSNIEGDQPAKKAREKERRNNGSESPGRAKRTKKKKGVSRTEDHSNGKNAKRKKMSTTSNSKPCA
jgi:ubiquitin carboxyl-terminal hydrolase 8